MRLSFALLLAVPILAGTCAKAGAAEGIGQPPTQQERDAIEERLGRYLVLPETTLWRFAPVKPYLGEEKLVCGELNFQSAMRKYLGYRRFYAILDDGQVTLTQMEDLIGDPSGRLHEKLVFLCGKG